MGPRCVEKAPVSERQSESKSPGFRGLTRIWPARIRLFFPRNWWTARIPPWGSRRGGFTAANCYSESSVELAFTTGELPNCLAEVEKWEKTVGHDVAAAASQCR